MADDSPKPELKATGQRISRERWRDKFTSTLGGVTILSREDGERLFAERAAERARRKADEPANS